jgi:glycerol-3-phosphate acyltransferase PlsY
MLRAVLGPGLAIAAYLIGSISFALIAGARAGVDLRAEGSGNPGATNVGRVLGKRVGRMVLAADLAKGALPAGAALPLLGPGDPWTTATGVAAVLGHCFPIWHGLRGGKGAATAAGVLVVLAPIAGVVAVVAYVLGKRASRRASVGSLLGAVLGGVVASFVYAPHTIVMSWCIAALVFVRHADNVKRLIEGTEPES